MVTPDTGTRFTMPDPAGYPLAPVCIIRQRRGHPGYSVRLPRRNQRQASVGFAQFTLAGRGLVESERGGVQDVGRGACLLATMHDHLRYAAAPEGWEFVFLTFHGRSAQCLIEDLVAIHGNVVAADPQHRVLRRLCAHADVDGVQSRQIDPGLAARVAGDVLLQLAEWNTTRDAPEDRLLIRATALLGRDLGDPPSVAEVARSCGVSREHLTRLFSARLGCPPGRWLRDERLRHAELLLRSGTDSVTEIAAAVGFHTTSAFVAAFRGEYGHPPGAYRVL